VITDVGTGWPAISDPPAAGQPPAPGGQQRGPTAGAEELDADADIAAFGCIAFFAATGRTPYGEHPARGEHLPRASEAPDLAGCPAGLLPVVQACLLPPAQRPSAKALLTMLEAAAGPIPRNWLPPAVTGRFADYLVIPDPTAARRISQPGGWLSRLAGFSRLADRLRA
jgi:hypothetical protein